MPWLVPYLDGVGLGTREARGVQKCFRVRFITIILGTHSSQAFSPSPVPSAMAQRQFYNDGDGHTARHILR